MKKPTFIASLIILIIIVLASIIGCNRPIEMKSTNLIVTGRTDEHTVVLWDTKKNKQYIFRVENAYSEAYDYGQEIWIINYPE